MKRIKRILSLILVGVIISTSQSISVLAEENEIQIIETEAQVLESEPIEATSELETESIEETEEENNIIADNEEKFTLALFSDYLGKAEMLAKELAIAIKKYDKNEAFVAVIVPDYTLEESIEWANQLKEKFENYENIKVHIIEKENIENIEYMQDVEANIYLSFDENFWNAASFINEYSKNVEETELFVMEQLEKAGLSYNSVFSLLYKEGLAAVPVITLDMSNYEQRIEEICSEYIGIIAAYYGLQLGTSQEVESETETELILEIETTPLKVEETEVVMGLSAFVTPFSVNSQEAQVRNFVTLLYTNILSRAGDTGGIDYWTKVLIGRTGTGAHVAMRFIDSPEFQGKTLTDREYVDILYKTVLNRQGEASGITYWTTRLGYGISRKSVAAQFLMSPEFKLLCERYGINQGSVSYSENRDQNLSYTRFVIRIYEKALNRDYDIDGLNYWTGRLIQGVETPESIAEKFFLSPEMLQKNLSNEEYVRVLYRTFLDREADASGHTYHVNRLRNGVNRVTVLYGFSRSPEFQLVINGIMSSQINGRIMESQYWSDPMVDDRTLLAAIIYTESRGEGYTGQLAVGLVVMNRMNHSAFPNNLRENIYWKNQFQPARTGVLTSVLNNTSVITATCWQAADAAIAMRYQTKTIPGVTLPKEKVKQEFDYLYFMTPAAYEIYKWPEDDTFLLKNHMFFSRVGYR